MSTTVYLSKKDRRMIDEELRSFTYFFINGLRAIDHARETLEDCEDLNEARQLLRTLERTVKKLHKQIQVFGDD